MKDVKFCRKKIYRSITAFVFSFIFAFYTIFSLPMLNFNVSAAAVGGSAEAWRFDTNQWVNANSQSSTEAEGEWLPVQVKLTNIQADYPGLAGLVFEVEYTFTKGGARFFDAVRSVQVSENITVAQNGKLGFPLDDTDVAYPTASGNAWDISTRAGIEAAQNNPFDYWWDSPVGSVNTGFIPVEYGKDKNGNGVVGDIPSELPLTQVNVPIAADLTDEPGEKTINGVQGFSFDDDEHRFYITGEQLVALGISPNVNNLVLYFQLHLARTSVWSQGNMKYFADSKANHGCWIYDQEPYLSDDDPTVDNSIELNTCNGAGMSPGASAHVSFGPSTLSANSQVQFPPIGAPTGTISGYKFEDVNNDGVWQLLGADGVVSSDDETALANWPISIVGSFGGVYVPLKTVYTDVNGLYTITMLTNDVKYYVCEDPGSMEMFQTYPTSVSNPSSDTNSNASAVSGVRTFDLRGNPAVTPVEAPGTGAPATDQEIASYVQYALNQGIQGSGTAIEWARWIWEVKLPNIENADGTASQANLDFGNSITPPSVQISKNANKDSVPETGGSVIFTYNIANSGLSSITVTNLNDNEFGDLLDDALAAWTTSGHTGPIVLAPGEHFSFTYTITLSSVTLTPHTNIVTVTAVDIRGKEATATATDTVSFSDELPVIDIVKAASPISRLEPGGVFNFSLTITNRSTETVTITALTDSNADAFAAIAPYIGTTMAPGQIINIPYTSTFTNAGIYVNNASITVRDNEMNNATDSDSETVTVEDVKPIVDIVKSASPIIRPEPGGIFTFTITITNNSVENVTITELTDTNPEAASAMAGYVGDILTPGQFISFPYDVTHTGAGEYSNTASVKVTDNENNVATDTDTEVVTVSDVKPVVNIEKSATPKVISEPGGLFTYTLKITNGGADTVTIDSLTDTNAAAAAAIAPYIGTTVAPGDFITITYSVTETEARAYENTATVYVSDDDGNQADDTDTETVTVLDVLPTIDIIKSATPLSREQPGGDFDFTITVTNRSPESVTIFEFTDTNPDAAAALAPYLMTTLDVGQTIVVPYTTTYNAVGPHSNTASIKVRDNELNVATDTDTEIVTVNDGSPLVDITKSANILSMAEPGGAFIYTITITNICSEPIIITNLTDTCTDPAILPVLAAQIGKVIPAGEKLTFTYSTLYTNKGTYNNIATVTIRDEQYNPASDSDSESVTITDTHPNISIVKTANTLSMAEPGGVFTFNLMIKNESAENVTITSLTDSNPGTTTTLNAYVNQTLTPGQIINVSYNVTHTDFGTYSNEALITVRDDDGNTASDKDTETVMVRDVLPSVSINKTCPNPTLQEPGGVFQYTIIVTNIGIEAFVIEEFTDTNPEAAVVLQPYIGATLQSGESITLMYSATHTEANLYPNIAQVKVHDNEGNRVTKNDNENVTVVDELPVVNIEKTATPITLPEPGGAFAYTVVVTNGSAEPVTITALTDSNLEGAEAMGPLVGTTLAAGASRTINYSVTHTQAGAYSNTASVTVTDNENNTATDSDSETVNVADEVPVVDIKKTASVISMAEPGGMFDFTIVITNAGTEAFTITGLTDTNPDALAALAPYINTSIAAGGQITINYSVPHAQAGVYNNTATVTVIDNESNTANDSDTETVTVRDMLPEISIVKSVDTATMSEPGGNFNYTLVIENNTVEEVTITSLTDTMPAVAKILAPYLNTTIAANGKVTITYALPFNHAGVYNNTAAVEVEDNEGNTAKDNDSKAVTVIDVPPTINIDKLGSQINVTPGAGATFEFTLILTNTSVESVVIKNLTDSNPDVNSVLAQYIGRTMLPAETIQIVYVIYQGIPGDYANTASITVNDNELNEAFDTDTVLVTVQETEALVIVATGDAANVDLLLILLGTSALMFALPVKRYIFKKNKC